MADFKLICILIVIYVKHSRCDYEQPIHKRVEEIKNLSKEMYGEVKDKEHWKFKVHKVDEKILYPRGDKHKLLLLSSLWREYYDCTLRSLDKLTSDGQVPSVMAMAYVGAVARLPCSVCVAPNEREALQWVYAESTTNMTFAPIQNFETIVQEDSNLTIYNVKEEHAGVYRCQLGDSRSMVVLEVVDGDNYNVVKPSSSRGPFAAPPQVLNNGLTLFSSWSPWSECSVCNKVGRRHRHGMCYVKLDMRARAKRTNYGMKMISDKGDIELFKAFPDGIPCQSEYLPAKFRQIGAIQKRRNEIMIGMCKVPCDDVIYYARSADGDVLEVANNTAGIYSLEQVLPKQPPVPARETIFIDYGEWIDIRCPGTILRDVPVVWRFGTKVLVPREVDRASNGRVFLNSRDHLVITKVLYRDANLYSCWQRAALAGLVRLEVVARRGGRAALAALALAAGLALRRAAGAARALATHSRATFYHLP